jgi:hypothetical protein
LEEIFVCEMMARVWSAVLALCDERAGDTRTSSIAIGVLTAHTEVSNRLLTVLVDGRLPRSGAKSLNRLRRVTERWTDLLLGRLNSPTSIKRFAHNAERATDFADGLRGELSVAQGEQSWTLLRTSLRAAFARRLSPHSANPDLNARIAVAIVGSLPVNVIEPTGLRHPLWFARMSSAATEMEMLVDQFLNDGISHHQSASQLLRSDCASE